MFAFIQGILKEKEPSKVVIETHGIGYRITIPLNTYTSLPNLDAPTFLYLSQIVREDAHTLYGFLKREERDLFELLITVSGIGPKTAAGLIGRMDAQLFEKAILSADVSLLSKMPGIGKKTAERLVIEMRDKMKGFQKSKGGEKMPLAGSSESDALHALLNLGYPPQQAQKAILAALKENADLDLAGLITLALQKVYSRY